MAEKLYSNVFDQFDQNGKPLEGEENGRVYEEVVGNEEKDKITTKKGNPSWVNAGNGDDVITGVNAFDMLAGNKGNDTISAPVIGQSFPYCNLAIENVVVADGMLTIGAKAASGSSTFFNDVKLIMTGAAADFDYAQAYKDIVEYIEGVEETVAPATVLGIELYDLNGRRIANAQQGIVIVKKYMSDGTILVEKVIKK